MPGNKSDKQGNTSANKQPVPKSEVIPEEEDREGEQGEGEHEDSISDADGQEKSPPPKKAKTTKRVHSMSSESDSEREKLVVKKKKKGALAGKKFNGTTPPSITLTQADIHRLADGSAPFFQQNTRANDNPIVLPPNMMLTPNDSGLINAHMSAYTKFLLDNNLLINQGNPSSSGSGSGNGAISQSSAQINSPVPNQQNKGQAINQGFSQILQNQGSSSETNKGILDDSSLDGNSNVDPLDFLPPPGTQASVSFLPQFLQEPAPAAPVAVPNVVEEQLLSKSCEAEKEVDQIDDSAVGPEVSEQIMLMVQNFLGRSRKAAKIDDLALEFLRPKNMPFLKSPKIEEEIYLDLSGQAKHFDKNCRGLQGFLNAGMTALMRCIQTLIELEKLHPKITQAGIQAKKALQLMAFTNRDINDRRKDALKVAVNADYLPLLKNAKPPSEDWLLGGSLGELIKQVDDSKKMSEKLMKNKKPQAGFLQEAQQGFHQNQANNGGGRNKFRNRFNKKDFKNQQNQGFTPRTSWFPQQQQQVQQPNWYQFQPQQQQLQHQYQQYLNQAYQTQQQQQQPAYSQNLHQQQPLGFQQAQYAKNFQQPYQPYSQKKKN